MSSPPDKNRLEATRGDECCIDATLLSRKITELLSFDPNDNCPLLLILFGMANDDDKLLEPLLPLNGELQSGSRDEYELKLELFVLYDEPRKYDED